MSKFQEGTGSFFVGFYTWIVTVFFGAVLIDIVYSNLIPEASAAFSEVSDFLLWIGFVTFLAVIGAIALAWNSRAARNLFIASFAILVFEFLIPVFFSPLIKDGPGQGLGTSIRITMNGMASLLAMIGLIKYIR
jgi:hypothetical protein